MCQIRLVVCPGQYKVSRNVCDTLGCYNVGAESRDIQKRSVCKKVGVDIKGNLTYKNMQIGWAGRIETNDWRRATIVLFDRRKNDLARIGTQHLE